MPEAHPFDRALRQTAVFLRQHYAGEEGRIGKGLTIALNLAVTLYPGSRAQVGSESNAEILYNVIHTDCDCPDQSAPGNRCKHRYAVALTRIAQAVHDLRDDEAV